MRSADESAAQFYPGCQCVTPIPKPCSRISRIRASRRISRWHPWAEPLPDAPPDASRTHWNRAFTAPERTGIGVSLRSRQTRAPAKGGRGAGSGYAELVALGVAQHDRMAPHVLVHPGDAGSRLHELFHLLRHQLLAFLALHLAVGHPDVEVNPVLDGLPLGHALEVQPGPLVGRV